MLKKKKGRWKDDSAKWDPTRGKVIGEEHEVGRRGKSSNTSSCLVVGAFEHFFIDAAVDCIELGAEARELALSFA